MQNNKAVLARRVAFELTDEEMNVISGGDFEMEFPPQTDWSQDYKSTSTSGSSSTSTNNGEDADTKKDF